MKDKKEIAAERRRKRFGGGQMNVGTNKHRKRLLRGKRAGSGKRDVGRRQ